jgi:hypothetical protein
MRTDGQTDITKLIIAFRKFAKTSKRILQLNENPRLRLIENKFPSENAGIKGKKWQDFLTIITLHCNINE